jgi:hypothetical protein
MSNIIYSSSAAQDLAAILSSLGMGTIGTDLFVWKEPDGTTVKDYIVTLYDTGEWVPPELEYGYEYPSVQVRVRWKSGDRRNGLTQVHGIRNAFHGYVGAVEGIQYHLIRVISGVMDIGEDDKGRPRWTFNCEIQRSST